MMDRRHVAVMSLISLLVACNTVEPEPNPGPGPSPGPQPFQCEGLAELSGVVPVEDPIPGRYIVVLKEPEIAAAGQGAAVATVRATAETFAATMGVSDVQVFDASIQGFSCSAAGPKAEEMAQAALYLASEESSYVTGSTFLVDGGITSAYVTPEG